MSRPVSKPTPPPPRRPPIEEPRKSYRKSDDELDEGTIEKIEQIEEGLQDMSVKFDRSVAELDQFKRQFLSKATEKTVSFL